jgi:hypothetical protein
MSKLLHSFHCFGGQKTRRHHTHPKSFFWNLGMDGEVCRQSLDGSRGRLFIPRVSTIKFLKEGARPADIAPFVLNLLGAKFPP